MTQAMDGRGCLWPYICRSDGFSFAPCTDEAHGQTTVHGLCLRAATRSAPTGERYNSWICLTAIRAISRLRSNAVG